MMADAVAFVMKAFAAGVTEFGRILNAIPGSKALIIAAFFLTATVGMIIMPLRGGRFVNQEGDLSSQSVSDVVSEVTRTTYSEKHPNGVTTRTVSHSRSSANRTKVK